MGIKTKIDKKIFLGFVILFLIYPNSVAFGYKGAKLNEINIREVREKLKDIEKKLEDQHKQKVTISPVFQQLTEEEKEDLAYMRQEEKLARDVYLALYDKWRIQIFKNIAASEQRHTDSVKELLNKYNIADPITNDSRGFFKDQGFIDLYNSLVEKGSSSEIEALKVGATIEDLDIKDLEDRMVHTNNPEIVRVYTNLMNGSKNHLRAFVSQLKERGEGYEPHYISQEEYKEIISSDHRRMRQYRKDEGEKIFEEVEKQLRRGRAMIEKLGLKSQHQVLEQLREKLHLKEQDKVSYSIEKGKLKIQIKKQVKILGVFKVNIPVEIEVNEKGDFKVHKPWWSFIFGI